MGKVTKNTIVKKSDFIAGNYMLLSRLRQALSESGI
jgi:hypothetical protein